MTVKKYTTRLKEKHQKRCKEGLKRIDECLMSVQKEMEIWRAHERVLNYVRSWMDDVYSQDSIQINYLYQFKSNDKRLMKSFIASCFPHVNLTITEEKINICETKTKITITRK